MNIGPSQSEVNEEGESGGYKKFERRRYDDDGSESN